jgi:hypothetical protein
MSWSHMYAAQKSKSVFVELSERNAGATRLLQEAQQAQPAQPPEETLSLARQAASRWEHLLQRIGKSIAPQTGRAPG